MDFWSVNEYTAHVILQNLRGKLLQMPDLVVFKGEFRFRFIFASNDFKYGEPDQAATSLLISKHMHFHTLADFFLVIDFRVLD